MVEHRLFSNISLDNPCESLVKKEQGYMLEKDYCTIDSHIHCGIQNSRLGYETIKPLLEKAGIEKACMFAPVEDIYNRDDFNFTDTKIWQETRSKANAYLKGLSKIHPVYPYFFVWNDFRKDELSDEIKGVKWHRHHNEPRYHYDDPRCEDFLQSVYERKLPIVLEEEFANTLALVNRINSRTPVIIPHLGMLNGGYAACKASGIWSEESVFADSALADPGHITDFIETYGAHKLLFGSDFPFGDPFEEKLKILSMNFTDKENKLILSGNIGRLLDSFSIISHIFA
jgi:predicted TIM-barrel fold metal-dependent hydrolase